MLYNRGGSRVQGSKVIYRGPKGGAKYPKPQKPVPQPVSQEKLYKEYWGNV